MTWRDVARRDLTSAHRSRTLPAVALAMLALTAGLVLLLLWLADPEYPPSMEEAVLLVGTAVALLVPLVAILATYGAVAGERTAGTVRFLLGLPNSRADAYAGKYVSRGLIVVVPLAVGAVLAAPLVAVGFEHGSAGGVLLLGAASVLYGLVFVGIGLAASVGLATETRAVAAALGAYLLLRVGWPAMQAGALTYVGAETFAPYPAWYYWLGRVNPINAYVALTTRLAEFEYGHPFLSSAGEVNTVATTPGFALAVLLAWAVAVPALGYLQFREADLV